MLKNKKLFSMLLASMMAICICSINAFAKVEVPLENGATMVVYESEDEIPEIRTTRALPLVISNSFFPAYNSYEYAYGEDNISAIPMGSNNVIRVQFTKKPSSFYMGLYNSTLGRFIQSESGDDFQHVRTSSNTIDFTNMSQFATYRLAFAGDGEQAVIKGTINVTSK